MLGATAGTEPGAELGPVISKHAQVCICSLVESDATDGDRLVLDDRESRSVGMFFCECVTQKQTGG
jgi:hypothetical protein